ncbi:hypothetical protein LCGC14_2399910, partial [marine sediment metagenome]
YIKNKRSLKEISLIFNCDQTTIWKYLKKFNIKIRSMKEAKTRFKLKKKDLIKEYIINHKSCRIVGLALGCNKTTVMRGLKQWKIKRRGTFQVGKLASNYKDSRSTKEYYCKCGKKIHSITGIYKKGNCTSCALKLVWKNKTFKNKRIKAMKKQWADSKYKKQQLKIMCKGRPRTLNKPESKLLTLLNKIFLNQYNFVGNGKLWIGIFNPDFIHTADKKIIEVYGDYWHNLVTAKKRDKQRLKVYNKHGYKTLIVWEHELKDVEMLKEKIVEFNKKGV